MMLSFVCVLGEVQYTPLGSSFFVDCAERTTQRQAQGDLAAGKYRTADHGQHPCCER